MLQLKNVSKSYTTGDFTQVALDNVSLTFRKNEFVAILGPSGSGKTTCLNIVGGLDQYDTGDLVIEGKSTKDFKDGDWDAYRNNSVGFIFQSYNLIAHLSIVDNVELGMTLSGVPSAEKHRRALEVLEAVGLKEHVGKRPNQLSGGQMQRVAIARALANDPQVVLADEPTGALDTQTSVQIMELIKEIAKDRLVIMVTHNPDLASSYANRVIEFRDGAVISDSNPPSEDDITGGYSPKKTSMSFFTALKLSGTNIATKKWRTMLTAFASSIGIVGIALILSLSNGFGKQIKSFESDSMAGFPIQIMQQSISMDSATMSQQMGSGGDADKKKFPKTDVIYPYDVAKESIAHTNVLTDDYVDYVEKIDPSIISGISYTRLVNMNVLRRDDAGAISSINTSAVKFSAYPSDTGDGGSTYLEKNYDLLSGTYPSGEGDLILVVDQYNKIDSTILDALGLDGSAKEIGYDDIVGREFKVVMNDDYYVKNDGLFFANIEKDALSAMYDSPDSITTRIVAIVRSNADNDTAVLSKGLAYSNALAKRVIDNSKDSQIVKAQEATDYNILTGQAFAERSASADAMTGGSDGGLSSMTNAPTVAGITKNEMLASIGATSVPYSISIYPVDFDSKDQIVDYLNKWNDGKSKEDSIIYTDLAAALTSLTSGIMDAITIVLIAFAAISLVVSLIMIGIITYISVLERTKEIGVLRALGARKKDVTRVFNAETFIIGTFSGLLGIGIAVALTLPANVLIEKMTGLANVAQLNPVHGVLLVVISVALTLLGGLLPARMAAKKNPVEALRTE